MILCNVEFCKNQTNNICNLDTIELNDDSKISKLVCKNFVYDKSKAKRCYDCKYHEYKHGTYYDYDIDNYCNKNNRIIEEWDEKRMDRNNEKCCWEEK